jgi:hypothetical protein
MTFFTALSDCKTKKRNSKKFIQGKSRNIPKKSG